MEATQHMPYAPPSAVLGVIRRRRDRGLADPVTVGVLQQVGVSAGNAPRTLQALKSLGLLDEEGRATDTFKRVSQASRNDYPATLAEVLRGFYHPIFNHVDPAQDDMEDIEDAFRGFEPEGQRQRMLKLFLGLCHEAGLVGEDKAPKVQSPKGQQRSSQRASGQRTRQSKPPSKAKAPKEPLNEEPLRRQSEDIATDYPLVQAVVAQLPNGGTWTQKRRDLWVQAMTSAVDLAIEIREPEEVLDGEVMPEDDQLELESY